MSKILQETVGPTTKLDQYFAQANKVMIPGWDLEYKNCVMTRMIQLLADLKPMRVQMQEMLNLGQENPFNVSLEAMTQRTVQMVDKNQKNGPRQRSDTDTNNKQSKEQGEGKVVLHIAEPSAPTKNNSIDMTNTDDDDSSNETNADANTNHDEIGEPTEAQSTMDEPKAHVALALGCDDYVLSAK